MCVGVRVGDGWVGRGIGGRRGAWVAMWRDPGSVVAKTKRMPL